jgi:hypothetical protein
MSSATYNISPSLVDAPRHNLERWIENVETHARSMCAMHDVTGALTLVMTDAKWQSIPVNPTNPIGVAAGHAAVYRDRPDFVMPAAHANNAASAVVNLHRMATTKHNDYSFASSTLTTVLLTSIGEANEDTLRTTFPALAPYMLTPRQIVDTMLAKHGVATGDDVSRLLIPLSQQLTSLSDLTKHMSTFLLASQRLTRSGQGETPYNYFKLFLESVSGFPSIGMCLTTYYSAHPAIVNQSLATLFPHLEDMKDYLLKSDPGTPFSGSAQHGGLTRKQRRDRANQPKTKGNQLKTNPANPRTQARTPRWSPHGPTLLAATPAPTPAPTTDLAPYVAEIQRLQAMLHVQAQSPYPDAHFGMSVPSHPATVFSASRPREFYYWLHGWNNTHHGPTCKIMGSNTAYTHTMKNATGPDNTGGNPKVGVPVHLHRPSFFIPLSLSLSCVSCLPSPTPNPHTPPPSSLASSRDKALALPHEATQARTALMATPWLEKAEGFISCPQEDTHARLTPEVLKKQTKVVSREQSEGHTSTPYEDTPTTSEGNNTMPPCLCRGLFP